MRVKQSLLQTKHKQMYLEYPIVNVNAEAPERDILFM